jgi:hypothetical protein
VQSSKYNFHAELRPASSDPERIRCQLVAGFSRRSEFVWRPRRDWIWAGPGKSAKVLVFLDGTNGWMPVRTSDSNEIARHAARSASLEDVSREG